MQISALLVSDDLILRSELKRILQETGVYCQGIAVAGLRRLVARAKVECIVLDIDDRVKLREAIGWVREGKLNQYAILGALVAEEDCDLRADLPAVNFLVAKGNRVGAELRRAIQSAEALMVHEKRRYFRHSVDVAVEIVSANRSTRVKMIDLSARGACLECGTAAQPKAMRLNFFLPGAYQQIEIEAVTAWTKAGTVGVEFATFIGNSEQILKSFLKSKEVELSPATV
jgi:DNA-binding NarL/FixJ family response regulator